MIQNLQRIQIKIRTDAPSAVNLDPFLEIFGRWRHEKEDPAQWVDLADYAHMPRGPGIVLVGHRCNISFDLTPPGPGILYAAKKGLGGSQAERMASAFQSCLEFTKRLTAEKEFPVNIHLRPDAIEIRFNDRLDTPNEAAIDQELRPALRQVLDALFGSKDYKLISQSDPKQSYGFSIAAKKVESVDVLLERMVQTTKP